MIVGCGIAGSALAYGLEKRGADYMICTDQTTSLRNTTSLSFGHCRVPGGISQIVELSVEQLGEDRDKMEFVYRNSHLVRELFEELGIAYEHRAFGIIPSYERRGGLVILEKLQQFIPHILTGCELVDLRKNGKGYELSLRISGRLHRLKAEHLVLATGGYGGLFRQTNNVRYNNYNVFSMVRMNGGSIVNMDCVFMHPFGYDNGRKVLVGKEVKDGEFVDENGNPVFDSSTRELLKANSYHELFHKLVSRIQDVRKAGSRVYFVTESTRLPIEPTVHYTSGGIKTDSIGRVIGCENLYAIGECQANGSRSQGRLPGQPFTSAIVQADALARILHGTNCIQQAGGDRNG